MTSKSISQNLNDSVTCIPNTQLRLAINLIEKGKITKEELDSTNQLVNYLNKRITTKDSLLYRYSQKDQVWKKIDDNNKLKINNLNEVISNSNTIIGIQSKSIKRSKFGKITMLILGLATGILITK